MSRIRDASSLIPLILLIVLTLSACTPAVQPYDKAARDDQARLGVDHFYASDETALPYRSWLPDGRKLKRNPKAVVIALHGFNDYSRAFTGAGEFFRKNGVAMFAYDQRGFGQAPKTGLWAGEKNLVRDLRLMTRQVRKRYPNSPLYLLGESMGGAEAIIAAAAPDFPKLDGIVLVAPAVWGEDTMHPAFRSALWLMARVMPGHELTGSDLKILASNNYTMLRRMAADPLVLKKTRVDAIYGVVSLMDSAYRKIPDVKIPVLLLYGDHDQVIPPGPIENALKRFTAPVTFAYYPDGFHMLLRDMQGERVMQDILAWIRHPGRPLPSGHSRPCAAAGS